MNHKKELSEVMTYAMILHDVLLDAVKDGVVKIASAAEESLVFTLPEIIRSFVAEAKAVGAKVDKQIQRANDVKECCMNLFRELQQLTSFDMKSIRFKTTVDELLVYTEDFIRMLSAGGFKQESKSVDVLEKTGVVNYFGNLDRFVKHILPLFPEHNIYVEPFCGRGEMIWHKEAAAKEILTDIDGDKIFCLRTARTLRESDLSKFDWKLTQSHYDKLKDMKASEVNSKGKSFRFYRWIYLLAASRSGTKFSFRKPNEGRVIDYKRRLENAKRLKDVVIEKMDYKEAVRKFDSAQTLFFVDPPYPDKQNDYYDFDCPDVAEIAKIFSSIKGKVIIVIQGSKEQLKPLSKFHETTFRWPHPISNFDDKIKSFSVGHIFTNFAMKKEKKAEEDNHVKISIASMKMPFNGCSLDYIKNTCNGACCKSKSIPVLSGVETEKLRKRGATIVNGLLRSEKDDGCCPFFEEGLCKLHNTPDKPALCMISPFAVNNNGTVIVQRRYASLKCFNTGNKTPAYKAYRQSLNVLLGKEEADRVCRKLDTNPEEDFEATLSPVGVLAAKERNRILHKAEHVLPVLKVSDPVHIVTKLSDNKPAFICSANMQKQRVGKEQYLVNEIQQIDGYDKPFAWGIIRMGDGRLLRSLDDLSEKGKEALDEKDQTVFADQENFFCFPLELIESFDEPIELKQPPEGRRFASGIILDQAKKSNQYADINPSGEGDHEWMHLDEVLNYYDKPMMLRRPIVELTGSICNHGESNNDIDILIHGPIDDATKQVIQFRLGRALPPELSNKIQFLDDDLGGPFTSHIPLYDLALIPRQPRELIEMSAKAADDPLMDLPDKSGVKHNAVVQEHWAASLHLDVRFQIDDYAVGITIAAQKQGIERPSNVSEAANRANKFDIKNGNEWLKSFHAPNKALAVPKSRIPLSWMSIDNKEFKPGTVGATANEPGFMVIAARPKVEWLTQKPYFHEWALTEDPKFSGLLTMRLLVGERPPSELTTDEEGKITPAGETFWTVMFAKDLVPYVVSKRAVESGSMPPLGFSALPKTLMEATPKEYRYWESNNEREAKEIRDKLVGSKWFTSDNVKLVDYEFRRVMTKSYLDLSSDVVCKEVSIKQTAITPIPYTVSWQYWKAARETIRAGVSKEIWHVFLRIKPGTVLDIQIKGDPLSIKEAIALLRDMKADGVMEYQGPIQPGQKIGGIIFNQEKETPSYMDLQTTGTVMLLENGAAFKKMEFTSGKLKGTYVLKREDTQGEIWTWERSESAGQINKNNIPTRHGIQIWNPENKIENVDRMELKPLALFKPMKPPIKETTNLKHVSDVFDKYITPQLFRAGIMVEGKYNGFRLVIEKKDNEVLVFTEDEWRNLADFLPGLKKEILEYPAKEFILDCECMALLDEKDNTSFVPRRDLAAYRPSKAPIDDSKLRIFAFQLLYHPEKKNLLETPLEGMRELLEKFMEHWKGTRVVISPAKVVHDEESLRDAIKWASALPGSEGCMFKSLFSTYSLGGENSMWAKLRLVRPIEAIVYEKHEVKDSPGVFNFYCAVGPIQKKDASTWGEVIKIKNKLYISLGKTFNSKTNADIGDVLSVEVTELLYDESSTKKILHWFMPTVVEKLTKNTPMTTDDVISLLENGEHKTRVTKGSAFKIIEKNRKERYVYGIVQEPDTKDAQGDRASKEVIKKAFFGWSEYKENISYEHKFLINDKIKICEKHLQRFDFTIKGCKIKEGSWMLGIRILDDDLWNEIDSGEIKGFSIGGTSVV